MKTINIDVNQIEVPPVKVRAGLQKSIKDKGVLVPILVTRKEDGGYVVLDGRRRVTAAREAGIELVPAILLEGGGPEVTILAHATRSENPISELCAIQEMVMQGMSEEEIAREGYTSIQRIRKLAKLNRLHPSLRKEVEEGKIAPGVAFQAARLPMEQQKRLLEAEKITGRAVREAQSARKQEALPDLAELIKQEPATFDEFIEQLSAGTLQQMLFDLPPDESRFDVWRHKLMQALAQLEVVRTTAHVLRF
ncbi:MAG: ParB N-terminal domain-containing protein [Anaerolineae bacterium]|nr:ParB N-terminal domain-containing protein [Anaerolineae bacterium]